MKKKSTCFLLTALFIGLFPVACVDQCDGPCGCNPVFENQDFSVAEISIETLFRSDNNQPIDPSRYYFNQTLYKSFYVSALRPLGDLNRNSSFYVFASPSFACDTPYSFAIETLKAIRIISRANVDIDQESTFLSGQIINDHFILTLNFQNEYNINDFLSTDHRFQIGERLNLKFIKTPLHDTEFRFDIEIEFTDGRTFEFRNEVMRIAGA